MFFSIIIPVYNVELYLRKAVDSALRQGFAGEYEIILIDDGSTDDSGKICDEYAATYRNIRVIHKQNGGQATARNMGLNIAKGEYIVFLDSDDWIDFDALETFHDFLKDNSVDALCFNFREIAGGKIILRKLYPSVPKGKILNVAAFFSFTILDSAVWSAIWSRSFLEEFNIRFKEGIVIEDALFSAVCGVVIRTITSLDYAGYNYLQRQNSTMRNHSMEYQKKRINDGITVLEEMTRIQNSLQIQKANLQHLVRQKELWTFTVFFRILESSISMKWIKTQVDRLKILGSYPLSIVSSNFCFRFYAILTQLHFPIMFLRAVYKTLPVHSKIWSFAEDSKNIVSRLLRKIKFQRGQASSSRKVS